MTIVSVARKIIKQNIAEEPDSTSRDSNSALNDNPPLQTLEAADTVMEQPSPENCFTAENSTAID